MDTRIFLFLLVLLLEMLPVQAFGACSPGFGIYSSGSGKRCVQPNPILDGFRIYSSGSVQAVAVQPWDGKIIIGGDFTATDRGGASRKNLARFNPDGTLDAAFSPPTLDGPVSAIAVWSDPSDPAKPGLIFVGGSFGNSGDNSSNAKPRGLAQIKSSDGSLVPGFIPVTTKETVTVKSITLQADDQGIPRSMFAGGRFPEILEHDPSPNFAKISLGSPGVRPPGWTYSGGIDGDVNAILLQRVGQEWLTLLGGGFAAPQQSMARFRADGSFIANSLQPLTPGSIVRSMALQADGKIIIGGDFPGQPLARLDSGGVPDPAAVFNVGFDPGGHLASVAVQPDGKILAAGSFSIGPSPARKNLARLKIDGTLDSVFAPPELDNVVNAIARQPDGKILAGGDFTQVGRKPRVMLARFYAQQGALDDDIPDDLLLDWGVLAVSLHPDGITTIAGQFFTVQGKKKTRFAVLREDWNLVVDPVDPDFDPGIDNSIKVLAPLTLPDKSPGLLVGGLFSFVNGTDAGNRQNLVALLDSKGKLVEPTFNAKMNEVMASLNLDSSVQAMALPESGKIYIGGNFRGSSPPPHEFLARFNTGGTLLTSFTEVKEQVNAIAVQPDGKVLVGTLSGKLLRLDYDGTNPSSLDLKDTVLTIALQNDWRLGEDGAYDGHIFVAGAFTSTYTNSNGVSWQRNLLRIKDGVIDDTFNIEASDTRKTVSFPYISGIALQADGSMLIYGVFNKVKDSKGAILYCDNVARIKPSQLEPEIWELDPDFYFGGFTAIKPSTSAMTVNLQPDGKIVLGGRFNGLNGKTTRNLVRFSNGSNGWASQELSVSPDGSKVTWKRAGTGPELWRVWFEYSEDPDAAKPVWTPLGNGYRIAGGWQLDKQLDEQYLTPGVNHYVRASGYVAGDKGSAGSLMESVRLYYLNPSQMLDQSITFGTAPGLVYGGATGAVSATATSGLPVSFTSLTTGVCTVSDATVTPLTAGTCTIAADQAGNGNYTAAEQATQGFPVAAASQSITFGAAPSLFYGGTTGTVSASATSGLPVSFTSLTTGICTVSGATVTPLTAGTCTIAANQAGNSNYTAAAQATQAVPVGKATPLISWTPPAAITYGSPLGGTQLNANSGGVAGSFVYTPASGTILNAGTAQTLSVTFTPTYTGNYNTPSAVTVAITVAKAALTVSAVAKSKTYGDADPALTYTVSPALSGTDSFSGALGRVGGETVPGSPYAIQQGTLALNGNYTLAYVAANLTIDRKALIVTAEGKSRPSGAPNPVLTARFDGLAGGDSAASLGGGPSLTTAADASSPAGSYAIVAALGSITSTNYSFSFVDGILTVTGAAQQIISFDPMRPKTFGDGDFDPGATASSGLPVEYASSAPGIATVVGRKIRVLSPGITDITASQAGNGEYAPAADVLRSLTVNPPPWNGLGFDGIDDLVRIGDAPQLNFGTKAGFSIEAWLRLDGSQPDGTGLVSKGSGGGAGGGYQLLLHQDRIAAEIGDGTVNFGVPEGLVGTSTLNDGQWHHVSLSVDRVSATASLYLDGRLEARLADPALGRNPDNGESLQVGIDRSGTRLFRGEIDELRVWDTARSRDEIRGAVSQILDPLVEPHLTGYFHFDEGDAGLNNASFTLAPERTANGANGVLRGFALSGDASNWVRSGAFLPLLETAPVSLVTASAAASGGVVYPNYYPPTDRGICWGSAPNPGLGDTCSHQGAGVGAFEAAIAGLVPGASYHVRGFATNGMGTAYGNDLSFQAARLDLTVTADDKVRAFGAPNPPLTASYTGFVNGENPTLAGITGSPVLWTDATKESPVGRYDINVSLGTLIASNYSFITKIGTVTVIKSCQEIVFPPIGERTFGDPPFVIQASACSGLGITFASSDPKVAQINGTTLTVTGAGVVVITASQGGTGTLDRAPDVSQTVVVHRSGQALGFTSLAGKVLGDPPFTLSATASSGLPVTYQSSAPSVAEVNGNTVTLKGAGTAVITARQPGNGNYNEALPISQPLTVASEGVAPLIALSTLPSGAVTANPVLNIMGTASDASGIARLTVNGADLTGRAALFSSAVSLGIGENSIEVTARDGAGNRTTETLSIALDAAAPVISLAAPADNSVSSAPLFTASGAVTPESEVTMGVNGSALQILSVTDGAFTGSGYLEPGVNTIEVSATLSGRLSRVKRSVTLAPGKPSVAITVPVEDIRTEHESITLRGTVEGEGCSVVLDVAGVNFTPAVQAGGFQQVIALDHTGEFPIQASVTDTGGNSSAAQRNIIRVDRILGDLNGDGCVDIRDALAVLRISLGIDQATAGALAHGDVAPLVNGVPQPDGKIDVGDLLLLLRKVVGLVDF